MRDVKEMRKATGLRWEGGRKVVVSDDFQISGLNESKKEQVWGMRRRVKR